MICNPLSMIRDFAVGCLLLVTALLSVEVQGKTRLKCPPDVGGLLTEGEPANPGPFHDITVEEHRRIYDFLEQQAEINLGPADTDELNTSSIFTVDLLVPPKAGVLSFLDNDGPQPAREAVVMIFRGDKKPAVVEEYRVGPLDNPTYAELIVNPQRKNTVPWTVRPVNLREQVAIDEYVTSKLIDDEVGDILIESYGGRFTNCGDTCLSWNIAPVGTAFFGDNNVRKTWLVALFDLEFPILYPLDFSILMDSTSTNPSEWTVDQVWYAGQFFDSVADFKDRYNNDPTIKKTSITHPSPSRDLKGSQNLRGDPVPTPAQRPPIQIEPDGKRYNISNRHIDYMQWHFDFRISPYVGPQVYDIRFNGDRIAYQLGLSEIAVFYTGHGPMQQVMNFVDSGELLGKHSRGLVAGADCPEGATFIDVPFMGEYNDGPVMHERAICVFEQNTGDPLRRHLAYFQDEGGFYGGMADSVLVVRAIMYIYNYDYIIDFRFHQSGAIEARAMSTGYIMASFNVRGEESYGWELDKDVSGNLHHHMFHFKADLDVGGISNRYETLDFTAEDVDLTYFDRPVKYHQLRFDRKLLETEEDAVFHYNFDKPRYHIVHNDAKKTAFGVPRAYRLHMPSTSKQLLRPDHNHEGTIPWARQQLAVTVQKDDEWSSSSPYAMYDSEDPTNNFSNYIGDESIVDQDLVFWISMGVHHLPHTEDLPVTPTAGGHLSFFLLPYNYFPECPSVSSRDAIRLEYRNSDDPSKGIRVLRKGYTDKKGYCDNPGLTKLAKQNPDAFLEMP